MSSIYKEYLSEAEAADFMCLAKSTFNKHKKDWDLVPYRLPGIEKNVYKRTDLLTIMEGQLKPCQPSSKEVNTGISSGQTDQDSVGKALGNMASQRKKKRKRTALRKKSN